jgi:hypothetical protein
MSICNSVIHISIIAFIHVSMLLDFHFYVLCIFIQDHDTTGWASLRYLRYILEKGCVKNCIKKTNGVKKTFLKNRWQQ